jgi:hypothetical protein
MLQNEDGMTLAEVLISVVILGTTFMLFASMLIRNQKFIALNEKIKEAQYVRDDIKEWMGYRAQTQDIAALNQYVFIHSVKKNNSLTDKQQLRISHLILDNSGIQYGPYASSPATYGEKKIEYGSRMDGGEERAQKIDYKYKNKESTLPSSFKDDHGKSTEEANYLGKYKGSKTKNSFLVICKITDKAANVQDYREEGLELTLEIYDEETGKFMTDTVFKWVADY